MAELSYPGVYIEEVPSGVRAIANVSTSVAAFVDRFRRGPEEPVEIFGMADFERAFGGIDADSPGSYAIAQFFLNGGSHAWVLRVKSAGTMPASVDIGNATGTAILRITAASDGTWANGAIRVRVGTPRDDGRLEVTVAEYRGSAARPAIVERFVIPRDREVTIADPLAADDIVDEINARSRLVTAALVGTPTTLPAPNGMTVALPAGPYTPTDFNLQLLVPGVPGPAPTITVEPDWDPADPPATREQLAAILERAIRTAGAGRPAFAGATLQNENGVWILRTGAGAYHPGARIVATTATYGFATSTGAASNVQEYTLGVSWGAIGAQAASVLGDNGGTLSASDLIGAETPTRTGLFRLLDIDLFNLLCIPAAVLLPSRADTAAVYSRAAAICATKRAFLLVDTPPDVDSYEAARDQLPVLVDPSANAAIYFPRVHVPDPLASFEPRDFGASGTVAGVIARTDAERGVWHAPAGVDAVLRGVFDLDVRLTDGENGVLNKKAINCLRGFPAQGRIVWGARTLEGPDDDPSEWKYVPVRRLALMIEEALYRGTRWAVFQPNDEPLWARLRQNVGAYLNRLFRQRAFAGATPREAYYVRCDADINPPADRELGIVTVEVGFAPLKPAEFVVIRIQQIAEIA
jgi:uncharacterized protein